MYLTHTLLVNQKVMYMLELMRLEMKQSFLKVLMQNLKRNLIRKISVLQKIQNIKAFILEAPMKMKMKHLKKKLKISVTSEQYRIS